MIEQHGAQADASWAGLSGVADGDRDAMLEFDLSDIIIHSGIDQVELNGWSGDDAADASMMEPRSADPALAGSVRPVGDSTASCWGGQLCPSVSARCIPGFQPRGTHLCDKVCDRCHVDGIAIDLSRVRALQPGQNQGYTNGHGAGLFSQPRTSVPPFRMINHTRDCSGTKLVIFERALPDTFSDPAFAPTPPEWIEAGGIIRLWVSNGTFVPKRPRKRRRLQAAPVAPGAARIAAAAAAPTTEPLPLPLPLPLPSPVVGSLASLATPPLSPSREPLPMVHSLAAVSASPPQPTMELAQSDELWDAMERDQEESDSMAALEQAYSTESPSPGRGSTSDSFERDSVEADPSTQHAGALGAGGAAEHATCAPTYGALDPAVAQPAAHLAAHSAAHPERFVQRYLSLHEALVRLVTDRLRDARTSQPMPDEQAHELLTQLRASLQLLQRSESAGLANWRGMLPPPKHPPSGGTSAPSDASLKQQPQSTVDGGATPAQQGVPACLQGTQRGSGRLTLDGLQKIVAAQAYSPQSTLAAGGRTTGTGAGTGDGGHGKEAGDDGVDDLVSVAVNRQVRRELLHQHWLTNSFEGSPLAAQAEHAYATFVTASQLPKVRWRLVYCAFALPLAALVRAPNQDAHTSPELAVNLSVISVAPCALLLLIAALCSPRGHSARLWRPAVACGMLLAYSIVTWADLLVPMDQWTPNDKDLHTVWQLVWLMLLASCSATLFSLDGRTLLLLLLAQYVTFVGGTVGLYAHWWRASDQGPWVWQIHPNGMEVSDAGLRALNQTCLWKEFKAQKHRPSPPPGRHRISSSSSERTPSSRGAPTAASELSPRVSTRVRSE